MKLTFVCVDGTNVGHCAGCMSQITQIGQPDSSLCWSKGSSVRGKGEREYKRVVILKYNYLNANCLELSLVYVSRKIGTNEIASSNGQWKISF